MTALANANALLKFPLNMEGWWIRIVRRSSSTILAVAAGSKSSRLSDAGRRSHRSKLVLAIAERMREEPASFWIERFAAAGVPCQPVMGLAQVVSDEQVRARGTIGDYRSGDGELYRAVRAPWKLGSTDRGPDVGAPALGRDTVCAQGNSRLFNTTDDGSAGHFLAAEGCPHKLLPRAARRRLTIGVATVWEAFPGMAQGGS